MSSQLKCRPAILFMLTLFAGCAASSYEKMNVWNGMGYTDKKIEEDVYWVTYDVNAATVSSVAMKFWHERAKELCGNRPYEHDAKLELIPKSRYNPYGNQTYYFPHVEGTVRCKVAA